MVRVHFNEAHLGVRLLGRLLACIMAFAVTIAGGVAVFSAPAAVAASVPDTKPYDEKITRLSEILGALHYLRARCGANDGQKWRDWMRRLLRAEGTTALRRAKFSRSFNRGYNSFSRTYRSCTPTASTAIRRFMSEALRISQDLVKEGPK